MDAQTAILNTLTTAQMVCGAYLGDMTDEDLMKRPHAKSNHINWQVGHLIASDWNMVSGCYPGALPELPEGFAEKYSKETIGNNDASAFHTKEELMKVMSEQHAAIAEKIKSVSAEELDGPAPEEMKGFAPTVGAVLNMIGSHWLMHCGQWVPVRRESGKDVVI